jgi:hypothetical protein
VAILKKTPAKAKGRTKKVAEQEAFWLLFQQMRYIDAPLLETNSTDTNNVMWEPPHGEWDYFEQEDDEMTKLDLSK